MATFLEGVESIVLLCSLVVILPTIALSFVARRGQVWLVGGAIVGTATMMWARAGNLWTVEAVGLTRWVLGGLVIATFVTAFGWQGDRPVGSLGLGLAAGLAAGWLWQPCVGEHFAEVLNRAETDRVASLAAMHAYVLGVSLPAVMLAALPHALPRGRTLLTNTVVRRSALVLAIVYGLTVSVGWYDDVVSELFRLSSR